MKHLADISDLSVAEIDSLIATAEDISAHPEKYEDAMQHKTLATLFFEPSTRTRLSFETAMLSLGGSVAGFSDADTSSASKGETLADTIEVVSGYVDIIAMRHYAEGAPYVAMAHSEVPIINAGDGGHFHPTQTLADLLTVKREKGRLDHLKIGFCGDLKYGRTVHSLIAAMARYEGTELVLISPPELALPDFVMEETVKAKGIPCTVCASLEDAIKDLDVLYMTRVQKERFSDLAEYERLKDLYILDGKKLNMAKPDTIVLHPLPRVNEITVDVDSDPRACYFKQTRNGKLMRMALILKLMNERNLPDADRKRGDAVTGTYACPNPHCVTRTERCLPARFYRDANGTVHCRYCDGMVG